MATLATIRTRVRDAVIVPASDPMFSDTRLGAWINDALQTISAEYDWPWLRDRETFTASGETSPLPTGWRKSLTVRVNGLKAHHVVSPDAWKQQDGTWRWTTEGSSLWVRPSPVGQIIDHVFVRTEPTLTADGDSPLLPDRYLPLLVAAVAWKMKMGSNVISEAREWRAEYERLLSVARRAEHPRPDLVVIP